MKRREGSLLAIVATSTILAACGSSGAASSEPAAGREQASDQQEASAKGMAGDMCPMHVPGTTVTTSDVEGGVAISFTTPTGDVAQLRERVRHMAEMHERHAGGDMGMGRMHHGAGGVMGGMHHGGQGGAQGGAMMPAASAEAEDVEGGARVVLRPKDPGQLDTLRQHVRTHVSRMQQGACPMMMPGAQESREAPSGE